ncbi:maleylpyruvate isomerase N-terminal domain-containing protein [Plantactinospora alkalitolerans]|uniref:maleylpyruvate isomerase N-terminal domain-containing protein n=1 Tax=Plantactinospora alkalitolerans TaxID=2789879 RepID=UPI002B2106D9|nr:maleylpyruvate isomerase N-terminal domain-containing protein [Plantactinospora alkalitolerans]
MDGLSDGDLDAPTLLPGWTRRHVVAHVHYNAEALRRLVHWARTGQESRMYADQDQRDAEIEQGARLPAPQLRELVRTSAAAFAADFEAMPAAAWSSEVVTAQGRVVPATALAWMRTREVVVHAVDLGVGITFADLPDDLNTKLALDVVKQRASGGEAAALAAWLTGRAAPPALGRWL